MILTWAKCSRLPIYQKLPFIVKKVNKLKFFSSRCLKYFPAHWIESLIQFASHKFLVGSRFRPYPKFIWKCLQAPVATSTCCRYRLSQPSRWGFHASFERKLLIFSINIFATQKTCRYFALKSSLPPHLNKNRPAFFPLNSAVQTVVQVECRRGEEEGNSLRPHSSRDWTKSAECASKSQPYISNLSEN